MAIGPILKQAMPILKQAGKFIVKFLKSKVGKAAMAGGAVIAEEVVREKWKASNQKTPVDEVEKKIAIIDRLLKEEKISKPEYDKRLRKILKSI